MGLNAQVKCNCYKIGKLNPFPYPELQPYIEFSEAGYLHLNLPYEGNEDAHRKIWEWVRNDACSHKGMYYASERITSWPGLRAFQAALTKAGLHHFPTLNAELPDDNGGLMSVEASARVLGELHYFREKADLGSNYYLVNTETGQVIYDYIPTYEGIVAWGGKDGDIGFDHDGFFIVEGTTDPKQRIPVRERKVLFRAIRFEQRFYDVNEDGQPGKVEFYNVDTEERFVSNGGLHIHNRQLLHVEARKVSPEEYQFIMDALETVCKAAVEMDNPVTWS